MAHPPAPLVELAAGRDPGPMNLDADVIEVATDHRMMGLLQSHLQAHNAGELELAMYDLRIQAHQRRIHALLDRCLDVAADLGVEVAVLKGVPIERRFYRRSGERPSSDVDLWVPVDQPEALHALAARLQPGHPWLGALTRMVARRQIQSVTMEVDGLEVDIHCDPLKLGVWTRQADVAWRSCLTVELDSGRAIRTLDDDWTVLLLLVHLSKDRFQRLLGYADVVRVMQQSEASWPRVVELARREGIADLVTWACEAVEADLGVALRPAGTTPGRRARARSWIWHQLWRPSIRLRGSEGRRRFRFRQDLLPLLGRGRQLETIRWWLRELFPPSAAVAAEYPEEPGPYVRRLVLGRWRATAAKRAARSVGGPQPRRREGSATGPAGAAATGRGDAGEPDRRSSEGTS